MDFLVHNRDDNTYIQTDTRDEQGIVFTSNISECRVFSDFSLAYGVLKNVKRELDMINLVVMKWDGISPREMHSGVEDLCSM